MTLAGADLLIYPTAIGWESTDTPEEQQRQLDAWQTVQRGHAVANGLPVITVNRCGYEPDPSGATGASPSGATASWPVRRANGSIAPALNRNRR